jgi:hypothetical protein
LALHRVKVSRFADLNDPFELLAVDLADEVYRKAFRETKEQINADKGLICFSRSWSNPLLWGHYAEGHTGMALGFEVSGELLAEVIYAKKPIKIPIDKATNKPDLSEELINRLLRTKFHDWKYEDEVRLFVQLKHETRESGLYFCDFSSQFNLREVVLGPRCELPTSGINALVSQYPSEVRVKKSKIAFSSFRVIENKLVGRF